MRVTTRRFDRGREEARVLEFIEGLSSRPVLRKLSDEENAPIGTKVEIEIEGDPHKHGGLLAGDGNSRPRLSLNELCSWLFPAFDCQIRTREGHPDWQLAVGANDWRTLPPADLLQRTIKPRAHRRQGELEKIISDSAPLVRDISAGGRLVARACVLAVSNGYIDNATDLGIMTVGGARAATVHRLGGVFAALPSRAARDRACPLASESAIREWASEQARLISASSLHVQTKVNAASVVRSLAAEVGDLPVAWSAKGWHNTTQVAALAKKFGEIIIISDSSKSLLSTNRTLKFLPNVLVTSVSIYSHFNDHTMAMIADADAWSWQGSKFHFWSCEGAVIEAIAKGWETDLSRILEDAIQTTDDYREVRVVAHAKSGEPISDRCDVIIRPGVQR